MRLEIERQSPGLTFCSLMEPLLMSAELLGGMFSYVEAKHMVAISLGMGWGSIIQIAFAQTGRVHCTSFSSPVAPKKGLLLRAKVTSPHTV